MEWSTAWKHSIFASYYSDYRGGWAEFESSVSLKQAFSRTRPCLNSTNYWHGLCPLPIHSYHACYTWCPTQLAALLSPWSCCASAFWLLGNRVATKYQLSGPTSEWEHRSCESETFLNLPTCLWSLFDSCRFLTAPRVTQVFSQNARMFLNSTLPSPSLGHLVSALSFQ